MGFYPEHVDSNRNQDDNKLEALPELDGQVERIDKRTLKPLNDPTCAHDWVDDDEVIGSMRAQTCKFCPLGRWVRNA